MLNKKVKRVVAGLCSAVMLLGQNAVTVFADGSAEISSGMQVEFVGAEDVYDCLPGQDLDALAGMTAIAGDAAVDISITGLEAVDKNGASVAADIENGVLAGPVEGDTYTVTYEAGGASVQRRFSIAKMYMSGRFISGDNDIRLVVGENVDLLGSAAASDSLDNEYTVSLAGIYSSEDEAGVARDKVGTLFGMAAAPSFKAEVEGDWIVDFVAVDSAGRIAAVKRKSIHASMPSSVKWYGLETGSIGKGDVIDFMEGVSAESGSEELDVRLVRVTFDGAEIAVPNGPITATGGRYVATYNAYKDEKLVESAQKIYNVNVKRATLSKGPLRAPNASADIEYFIIQFVDGGVYSSSADAYVWKAETPAAGHQFIFRVNYATSGVMERAPGQMVIRIPKTILMNKNGQHSDKFEMSVPLDTDVPADNTTEEFVYKVDGDDIVFYNRLEVSAAKNGYFEVAYETTESTFAYRDTDYTTEHNHLPFHGTLTVSNGTGSSTVESENLYVEIDTTARIASTSKYYPVLHRTWDASWGDAAALMPDADPSKYYYLVWQVSSYVAQYPTQKYTFTLDDGPVIGTVLSYPPEREGEAALVGYKMQGTSTYSDNHEITGQTSSGYRYDYVLTRHRKLDFAPGEMTSEERAAVTDPSDQELLQKIVTSYKVQNHVTATVTPEDGVDDPTVAKSQRTYVWQKPVFSLPLGHFAIWKYGDENWEAIYHTRRDYVSYALDQLQDQQRDITHIDYVVRALGYPTPWTLEGNDASDPSKYYKYDVTYDVTDKELYLINPLEVSIDNQVYSSNPKLVNGELDDLKLNAEDYDFSQLGFKMSIQTAEYVENQDYIGYKTSTASAANEDIHLSIYVEEDGELVEKEVGVFKAGTGVFAEPHTEVYDTYVSEVRASDKVNSLETGVVILFNPGVKGYRFYTSNRYYFTGMYAYPHVTLHSTENTQRLVRDADSLALDTVTLKNTVDMTVTSDNPKHTGIIYYDKKIIGDRLRRAEKDSSLSKAIVSMSRNNPLTKKISVSWKLSAYETIKTDRADNFDYVYQDGTNFGRNYGGVLYDLLPAGAQYEKGSVLVKIREYDGKAYKMRTLDPSEYQVSVVENYVPEGSGLDGSGRTMLKITVFTPGYGYEATFDTMHSWEDLLDYGKSFVNPAAYETGNDVITYGHKPGANSEDLPRRSGGKYNGIDDEQNRKYMYNLDPEANVAGPDEEVGRFLFTEYPANINALTAAVSGLNKKVMAGADVDWSYDTTTSPAGVYKYRWRFANTYVTKAKDMIFFDSLENYEPGRVYKSDWQFEKLLFIDTSQMETMYDINPVVYLSTVEKLDLSVDANHDITNSAVWQERSAFLASHELSDARAIAIDIRKKTDGSDFVLDVGQGVEAVFYYQAPSDPRLVVNSKGTYPETYNNIYIQDTVIDIFGHEQPFYVHQDYTTVRYRVAVPITIYKYSSENVIAPFTPDSPISGITFQLTGVSDYGTTVDMKVKSNAAGRITFEDIERGTYKLSEYECSDDWQKSETEYTIVVGADGHVILSYVDAATGDIKEYDISAPNVNTIPEPSEGNKILNDQRIHTDIEFYKRELGPSTSALEGVQFQLTGTSGDSEHAGYGNYINITATSDSSGRVVFPNVELGTYKLKEIATKAGYVLYDKEIEVVVDANGNFAVRQPDDEGKMQPANVDSRGRITIENEKEHVLSIFKKSSYGDRKPVAGATFKLWGMSDYGHSYEESATSGADGFIYFKHLEAGTYMLQETNVEGSYVMDSTIRIVKIGRDETKPNFITVDGCEQDEYGYFNITNTELPNDKIIVIKHWDDDLTGQDALPVSQGGKRPIPVFHISGTDPSVPPAGATTVHFNANGGKFEVFGELVETKDVWYDFATTPFRQMAAEGIREDKRYEQPTYPDNEAMLFGGWYTDAACTDGNKVEFTKTDTGDMVPSTALADGTTLYAKWRQNGIKYAVALYDIAKSVDETGRTMGLTFGPATGFYLVTTRAPYISELTLDADGETVLYPAQPTPGTLYSYIAHTPVGKTEVRENPSDPTKTIGGNPHLCIHDCTWDAIIYWNEVDPFVFEQCIRCGCTHSVILSTNRMDENQTVLKSDFAKNSAPTEGNESGYLKGDGPSVLSYELMPGAYSNENHRWHPNGNTTTGTNSGGWGASRIRAMLNGADEYTDIQSNSYANYASSDEHKSASIYTESNCLFAAFPENLQAAIGKTAVKYDPSYNYQSIDNLRANYDKLWLLSPNEMWTTEQMGHDGFDHSLEGPRFKRFEEFSSYMNDYFKSQNFTKGYYVYRNYAPNTANSATNTNWWLRSVGNSSGDAMCVMNAGNASGEMAYNGFGVAPCFALSR